MRIGFRAFAILAALVGVTFGLAIFDWLMEPAPVARVEILVDLADRAVLVMSMVVVAWVVLRVQDLRRDQMALRNNLTRAVADGAAWRDKSREQIDALSRAIQDQFTAWGLTPAEKDIAALMLKGCSSREIALARETTDTTIRQQAQGIYRKSGLSGRSELSAFFLESLFDTVERGQVHVLPQRGA